MSYGALMQFYCLTLIKPVSPAQQQLEPSYCEPWVLIVPLVHYYKNHNSHSSNIGLLVAETNSKKSTTLYKFTHYFLPLRCFYFSQHSVGVIPLYTCNITVRCDIWRSLLFDDDQPGQDEDKISNDLCLQMWRTIHQSVWMSTKLPEVNGTNLFIIYWQCWFPSRSHIILSNTNTNRDWNWNNTTNAM